MEKELCGVILVNKHKGVTSHDIVFKIRRLFGTKRVGHTGTLDPLATGVLPVLVGRAAKAAEYLLSENKKYVAELKLGITTDTEDITGQILSKTNTLSTKNEFFDACTHFVGDIEQIPPMYSALKVNGEKLVDLARRGIEIERQARKIKIYSITPQVINEEEGLYRIEVHCSKGTYIRTLCADIGAFLGCGAAMTELMRTESGGFKLENAYTVEQLEEMSVEQRHGLLMPVESLFEEAEAVELPDFYARLCRSGCEIYQKKIKTNISLDSFVRIYDKNGFFALGQVKNYPDGSAIKAIKLFVL
ncbi:MAG: tRNA pseudouridine(55) synthase TruB [Ruminococcaceae bacterium]|nr:tRNA pseudouridine(55) synthase TruB [Oscillospiraceae bacterium]